MTNNAHMNCTHPATKTDRARCRKANGGPTPKGLTVKPAGHKERHVVELCSCNGPADTTVFPMTCTLCDRPVPSMTALGLLLTA